MLLGRQRLSLRAMHAPRPPRPLPSPQNLGWADLAEGWLRGLGACVGAKGISFGDESGFCWGRGGCGKMLPAAKALGGRGLAGRRRGSGCSRSRAECARTTMTAPVAGGGQGRAAGLPWPGLEACAGPACSEARRRADGGTAMAARTRPGPRRARAPARAAAAATAGGRGGRSRAAGGGAGGADKGGAEGVGPRLHRRGRAAAAARLLGGRDRERELSETPDPPERGAEGEGAKMASGGERALSSWVPAAADRPGRRWRRLRRAGEGADPASPLSRQYKRLGASPRTCPSQNGGRERAEVT